MVSQAEQNCINSFEKSLASRCIDFAICREADQVVVSLDKVLRHLFPEGPLLLGLKVVLLLCPKDAFAQVLKASAWKVWIRVKRSWNNFERALNLPPVAGSPHRSMILSRWALASLASGTHSKSLAMTEYWPLLAFSSASSSSSNSLGSTVSSTQ